MLVMLLTVGVREGLLHLLSLYKDFFESLDVILFCFFGKGFICLGMKSVCIVHDSIANSYLPSDVSLEIILVAHIGLKVPKAIRLLGRRHGETVYEKII